MSFWSRASARSLARCPIAIAIAALLIIVVTSYRQTVKAYPERRWGVHRQQGEPRDPAGSRGGRGAPDRLRADGLGVGRRRRGSTPSRRRVRRSAAYQLELSLVFVVLITLTNLRGVRESGTLFAFPTYAFIVSIAVRVAAGLTRCIGRMPGRGARAALAPLSPRPWARSDAVPSSSYELSPRVRRL